MSNMERKTIQTESFADIKIDHYYPTVDSVKVHYTESGEGDSRLN